MSKNNNNNGDEWITVTKKQKKSTNDDDIPKSFPKINHSKPLNKPPQPKQKTNIQTVITNNNIIKKIDEGEYAIKKVSGSLSQQIIKARQEKGWTQKEFATLCNFNVAIIRDYENGTGIPKNSEMNIMTNILGATLSNK